MADLQDTGRYISEGFSFYAEKDAALAEDERRKVEYLKARLDYNNAESILRIYKKAIAERIFKSPVGLFFLREMQQYLLRQPDIDAEAVDAIPLYVSFESDFRDQSNPARNRVKPAQNQGQKKSLALRISVIANIGLAAAVIAMFAIALGASQPNILNYERVLTNRYASWEQELMEREQVIRAQELEWNNKMESGAGAGVE